MHSCAENIALANPCEIHANPRTNRGSWKESCMKHLGNTTQNITMLIQRIVRWQNTNEQRWLSITDDHLRRSTWCSAPGYQSPRSVRILPRGGPAFLPLAILNNSIVHAISRFHALPSLDSRAVLATVELRCFLIALLAELNGTRPFSSWSYCHRGPQP